MIEFQKLKPQIDNICRTLAVKRLGLFGSVLTENFSENSDIDVLVLFDPEEDIDSFTNYFELKEQLEKIFCREVDLTVDKPFKNPIFRSSVEKTRVVLYEQ